MDGLIFSNIESILRVVLSAPILYIFLIVITNLMGKRTTGQMNNFDWAMTVAMGALLATPLTTKDISILDGITGIVMYMLLQYIATKSAVHFTFAKKAIKLTPSLLLYQGEFIPTIMKKERVIEEEIYAAIRQKGHSTKNTIHAVVLETDGQLSVITNEEKGEQSDALTGVTGWEEAQKMTV